MATARVLICDDENGLRAMLGVLLKRRGYDVRVVEGVREAIEAISNEAPDVIVTDLMMPDGTGLDVLRHAQEIDANIQTIVMTAFAATGKAVDAMRAGAYDFIEKPFQNEVLLATVEKAIEKQSILAENRNLKEKLSGVDLGLIGVSQAMQGLRSLIFRAADARTSVLITGESGTGKEVVAKALHLASQRAARDFITVNCGALPEHLIESELFGHEKGAFTGASQKKEGLFRAADGGTLFLDEIGELPQNVQVKLLRALQERKVRSVGGEHETNVDVRVIAATNRELEVEVREGRFREDLFYRLNVIRIALRPLRERPEDVRPLAHYLLEKHNELQGRHLVLAEDASTFLTHYPFPGNVRELENLIERAVALAPGQAITRADVDVAASPALRITPTPLPATAPQTDRLQVESLSTLPDGFDLDAELADWERRILQKALDQAGGVRSRAAKLVGMTFRSFRYRLAKYNMDSGED